MVHIGDLIRFGEGLMHGEDVAVLGMARIAPPLPVLTGGRGSQFFPDGFGRFEESNRVVHRFGHLGLSVGSQDLGGRRKQDLRFRKGLSKPGIEFPGNLPRKLHVLNLVLSHRDITRLVDEDIGRLEHRIVEKSHIDVLPVLLPLLLKLGHPLQFSHRGHAVEDPGELGVFVDMGLDKEVAPVRRQSAGQRGSWPSPESSAGRRPPHTRW